MAERSMRIGSQVSEGDSSRASIVVLCCWTLLSCSRAQESPPPAKAEATMVGAGNVSAVANSAAQPLTPASAPTPLRAEVPLESDGGTFLIPVTINDAISLKFTIDSGASDVTIPSDVASTLVRAGTISADDYIGSQTFVLADGSQVPSPEFRIRSLRVGPVVLHNIVASITGSSGTLLLGQTFLRRLRSWSVDNGRHTLLLEANPEADASAETAPIVASITPETPAVANSSPHESVASMQAASDSAVMQFYAAWSDPTDPDGQAVREYFGEQINFYGKPIGLQSLMSGEILRFARRWPIRTYTVRRDSLQSHCSSQSGVCNVVGVVDWSVASATRSRQSRGTASFALTLSRGRIIAQNGRVLSRTVASPQSTQSSAEPSNGNPD